MRRVAVERRTLMLQGRALLVALAVAALVTVVAYAASRGAALTTSPLALDEVTQQSSSAAPTGSAQPRTPFGGTPFDVVITAILVLAAAPIGYALVRLLLLLLRVRRRTDLFGDSLDGDRIELRGGEVLDPVERAQRLLAGVDAGLAGLDATDSRRAVIDCWVRLEQAVAELGVARRPEETATDLAVRTLADHRVPDPAVHRLLALYHEARYSAHPIEPGDLDAARSSLGEVRTAIAGVRA